MMGSQGQTDQMTYRLHRGDCVTVMVSPSAWAGLDAIAKELGYKSRSDLIEGVGRREVELTRKPETDE